MEIIRHGPGRGAPTTVECHKLEELADGSRTIAGAALVDDRSVALVVSHAYPHYKAAEAAGLVWTADQSVEKLYLEVISGRSEA